MVRNKYHAKEVLPCCPSVGHNAARPWPSKEISSSSHKVPTLREGSSPPHEEPPESTKTGESKSFHYSRCSHIEGQSTGIPSLPDEAFKFVLNATLDTLPHQKQSPYTRSNLQADVHGFMKLKFTLSLTRRKKSLNSYSTYRELPSLVRTRSGVHVTICFSFSL